MSSHSLTQFASVLKYTPNPSSGETTCPSSPGENFNFSSKFMSLGAHLDLLKRANGHSDTNSAALNAPIFTQQALEVASGLSRSGDGPIDDPFSQYGLLAGDMEAYERHGSDPRIFYNIAVPSSVFICGSQGSGKSHSLSCILENALLPSVANVLPDPLTGIVFHYDAFISDTGGSPCEAAFISSSENVFVRVLCAPTSIAQIRRIYSPLPNVVIEELRINESDLNTRRMLDLMAVNPNGEGLPLYLHVIMRILRDLRIHQQKTGATFNYGEFKRMVDAEALKEGQLAPLQQRLATLESFMNQRHASSYKLSDIKVNKAIPSKKSKAAGNIWKPKASYISYK
ncbi:Conserved hypothetical, protein [Geosmithia morbida]|uniref:Conserved hypothetical, protein n=1 Tax=Geosmithia morbida TaxID=1094350 RepID=A0A9P4YYZ4_9HYPO|nr:Conserved hypothetical, protein [Geosmithia morbida]KAF4125490.1 Conserved hypothetical, protein [Geosmithia morbida]